VLLSWRRPQQPAFPARRRRRAAHPRTLQYEPRAPSP